MVVEVPSRFEKSDEWNGMIVPNREAHDQSLRAETSRSSRSLFTMFFFCNYFIAFRPTRTIFALQYARVGRDKSHFACTHTHTQTARCRQNTYNTHAYYSDMGRKSRFWVLGSENSNAENPCFKFQIFILFISRLKFWVLPFKFLFFEIFGPFFHIIVCYMSVK